MRETASPFSRTHVRKYGIVDTDARVVERWPTGDERPEILLELLEWTPAAARSAINLNLMKFFERVAGEG